MMRMTLAIVALASTMALVEGAGASLWPVDRLPPSAQPSAESPPDARPADVASAGLLRGPSGASARKGVGVLALDWGDLDKTAKAGTGDYLVIQAWEYARIPALRRDNPQLRILMYKDASATVRVADDSGIYATGVSYAEVAAHHPGWFLTDPGGTRLEWSDWPGLYPLNVRNAKYQRAWLRNVLVELRAHAWDGVMLDDTLTYLSHPTFGDLVSTQIPNDASMYRATGRFLAHVGPGLRRAGYLAVPNVSVEWNTWKSTLEDWSRYVGGWENEYFVKWGLERQSRFSGADWGWKMRMAQWCAARRLPLLAITYSNRDDVATQSYHRATWLLSWNGTTGASIFVPAETDASHWVPRANTYLGAPTGKQKRTPDGMHTRTFAHGMVLVNPTDGGLRVPLVGTNYRTLSGTRVQVAHVAGGKALLLRSKEPGRLGANLARQSRGDNPTSPLNSWLKVAASR